LQLTHFTILPRGALIYRKLMVSLNWLSLFSFAATINANPLVYAHHVASFTIHLKEPESTSPEKC